MATTAERTPTATRPGASTRPRIRDLAREEVEAVLRRNQIGRIAYTIDGNVDIEPISYVYYDGALYGRTAPGTMLTSVWREPTVAFEVDEVDALVRWRSVVVHGVFHRISPDGTPAQRRRYRRAVGLLRRVMPEALRDGDPFPDRTVVFRIPIRHATGRASYSPKRD